MHNNGPKSNGLCWCERACVRMSVACLDFIFFTLMLTGHLLTAFTLHPVRQQLTFHIDREGADKLHAAMLNVFEVTIIWRYDDRKTGAPGQSTLKGKSYLPLPFLFRFYCVRFSTVKSADTCQTFSQVKYSLNPNSFCFTFRL